MELKYWAFIYLSPNFSQEKNTTISISDSCKVELIGIDIFEKEKVLKICQQLVVKGVQTIELCGGFGPVWVAKVLEAINYEIPVGSVMYGPEFRKPLYELMTFKK